MLWENGELSVRELVEKDAVQLAKWLSNPELLRYYEGRDNPFDLDKVMATFFHRKTGTNRCLVEWNKKPIGYIQYYVVDAEYRSKYGYDNFIGNLYGMDQFIGETDYWNRGIGTALVQSMSSYLIETEKADAIVMDPQAWNERAIRSYEKCGFAKIRLLPNHEYHEGEYRDCWLIEYKADRS
ncbi:GNAT family N-acetyltransferase [Chungangia koreensis]|uniref:GNAT family N-acetyltransferase n=1 Tax=Chungangia koreensis TaxID=752657 RepID=A0ABV8X734_9LACT